MAISQSRLYHAHMNLTPDKMDEFRRMESQEDLASLVYHDREAMSALNIINDTTREILDEGRVIPGINPDLLRIALDEGTSDKTMSKVAHAEHAKLVELIAGELGVTPERVNEAASFRLEQMFSGKDNKNP